MDDVRRSDLFLPPQRALHRLYGLLRHGPGDLQVRAKLIERGLDVKLHDYARVVHWAPREEMIQFYPQPTKLFLIDEDPHFKTVGAMEAEGIVICQVDPKASMALHQKWHSSPGYRLAKEEAARNETRAAADAIGECVFPALRAPVRMQSQRGQGAPQEPSRNGPSGLHIHGKLLLQRVRIGLIFATG
jgi:hypothetical protein